MRALSFAIVLLIAAGCGQTTISLDNNNPKASLQSVRWVPQQSTATYQLGSIDPGGSGRPTLVVLDDRDRLGALQFELSVEGQRVFLTTGPEFQAVKDEHTTFVIDDETKVSNPVVELDSGDDE